MPNKSKASPPGSNQTRSSSPDEFLMQEQPHQPRGSNVESIKTQDMVDQSTQTRDMVDQSTQTQDMVDQSTQTQGSSPALRSDDQFHGRVIEMLRALNSILAKKEMRATRNPLREERDRLDANHSGIITPNQNDISLISMLGLRRRVPPEEDLSGDQTVVSHLQTELNPYGEPLAKRMKVEGTQDRPHGSSYKLPNTTNAVEKSPRGRVVSLANLFEKGSVWSHRQDQKPHSAGM
ncbi:uncharacterized protein LOC122624683 [Drosophila teissieri]|uniref:uncharacterized protein LOC122624683 n=1 Tax=Drosophila teissieri TaxID=7243 RepID=UPI001CBA1719|nr:uncharacterized protein LOC122624683 [Drosophila teissieri]